MRPRRRRSRAVARHDVQTAAELKRSGNSREHRTEVRISAGSLDQSAASEAAGGGSMGWIWLEAEAGGTEGIELRGGGFYRSFRIGGV
nr:unnamed protein product [Digitaria exilis]